MKILFRIVMLIVFAFSVDNLSAMVRELGKISIDMTRLARNGELDELGGLAKSAIESVIPQDKKKDIDVDGLTPHVIKAIRSLPPEQIAKIKEHSSQRTAGVASPADNKPTSKIDTPMSGSALAALRRMSQADMSPVERLLFQVVVEGQSDHATEKKVQLEQKKIELEQTKLQVEREKVVKTRWKIVLGAIGAGGSVVTGVVTWALTKYA